MNSKRKAITETQDEVSVHVEVVTIKRMAQFHAFSYSCVHRK